MKEMILQRLRGFGQGCTVGVLYDDEDYICLWTVEREWKDNKKRVSCIPAGDYKVVKHFGEKYKDVWRLEEVPNRDGILIHCGNVVDDTVGCILIGMSVTRGEARTFLNRSRVAWKHLKSITGDKEFLLKIRD